MTSKQTKISGLESCLCCSCMRGCRNKFFHAVKRSLWSECSLHLDSYTKGVVCPVAIVLFDNRSRFSQCVLLDEFRVVHLKKMGN